MCAHGRGRGSGAIFSRKKGTEIFIRFLRAVLKSCLLKFSYRPRDDKEERGAPETPGGTVHTHLWGALWGSLLDSDIDNETLPQSSLSGFQRTYKLLPSVSHGGYIY